MLHELPRKVVKAGSFPGAPMHPHRGFNEVPYCKILAHPGKPNPNRGKCKVNGVVKDNSMDEGDLEWGMTANGIEHEFLTDPTWSGEMHFFQMWVNLPAAHKRDNPEFQNASSGALPK